jgi:hypothetical protein
MRYYPIQKQWRKLKPIYGSIMAAAIWHPEMEAFAANRARSNGYPFKSEAWTPELRPWHYDSCDWRWDHGRPGPNPSFWDYTCHSACHWTCSLHLWVAKHVQPDLPWRIVTSDRHSTVWDGAETLWDGNFLALGVPADEAWELAAEQPDSEMLPVGALMLHDLCEEAA